MSLVRPGGSEMFADIVQLNQKRIAQEKAQQKITLQENAIRANIVKLKVKVLDIKSAHNGYIEGYDKATKDLAKEVFGITDDQLNQLDNSARQILTSELLRFSKIRKNLMRLSFLSIESLLFSIFCFMEPNMIIPNLILTLIFTLFPPIGVCLMCLEEKINLNGSTRRYIRGLKHFENKCGCSKKIALKEAELNCLNQKIRD